MLLNAVYTVTTLLCLFSVIFLPISLILCAVVGIVFGFCEFGGYLAERTWVPEAIGTLRLGSLMLDHFGLIVFVVRPIFLPHIVCPAIVLGSMLGWCAYEGSDGGELIDILYKRVFASFTEWTFTMPSISFDMDLLGELSDHFTEALLGFDPEDHIKVSTGLATLNYIISTIKPFMLFGNIVIGWISNSRSRAFEVVSVADLVKESAEW